MRKQNIPLGLTFDDILLIPQSSAITPDKTDVKTKLSRNITLNIPLVSAPMDTVTESRLAIAIALLGGIGFIHKNLTPEKQAEEVEKVKRWRNSFIEDPVTLSPEHTIADVWRIRKEKGYKNIPIVDKQNKVVGLITKFDYFWPEDAKLPIKKLMRPLKDIVTAPVGTSLKKARQIIKTKKTPILLIIDKQQRLHSIVSRSDVEKNLRYPSANKDAADRLRVGAAISVGEEAIKRAKLLKDAGVDVLVIDTAHGHSKNVMTTLKKLKQDKSFGRIDIIAGNIGTAKAASDLIRLGADAVKVGIGPGSICTTRVVTGIGVPQVTAILNAVEGRRNSSVPIIADGGIRYSGDIVKALAIGADSVMIGKLFAATEESPGELTYFQGKTYKVYRGMGSLEAMQQGSKDRYGQGEQTDNSKLVPEGIVGQTLYKGKLENIIHQLVGGLKSGMGYIGARNLTELKRKAQFVQISANALKESHPHDIIITKEAPNYQTSE